MSPGDRLRLDVGIASELLAQGASVTGMKPADLSLFRTPGAPTLAPDGSHAVVPVTRLDLDENEYVSQLWLVPTDGSDPPRPLTHGRGDGAPRYSPDGRWLAFMRAVGEGKPQLWVLPTGGGEPRQVTDLPLGAAGAVWAPDSGRIAFVARVPEQGRYGTDEKVTGGKEPPRRITGLQYRLDNVGFLADRRSHVFVVDPFADEPEPDQVTAGDFEHEDVQWSPDGSRIVFGSRRHDGRDTDLRGDLFTAKPDGSDLRQVTATTLALYRPAYAPDGATIYCYGEDLGPDGVQFVGAQVGLWAVPADGSTPPQRLTDAETYNAFDGAGRTVVTPTGVLFGNENRGAVELLRVAADGGAPQPVLTGHRVVKSFDAAGDVVVATVADPGSLGELILLRDGTETRLTSFGADLTGQGGILPQQEIEATAPDGYPVHGWLVRPEGEGPHPVLLMIHGGPFAQYEWALFDEAQVYAGAGYAVVYGNPRGSSGYGAEHGRFIAGDVGERSAADLFALLDAALEQPALDGGRMGVLGGSHGGFMTTWIAGHSDRFAAAISERALNAIDSFAGSSDIGWAFPDQLYASDPDEQRAMSPLTYADRITAPMLIIHSEHDWRCPVEQAQRLFVALKQRGLETELLLFPGEGHEMSRSGLPSHRVARFEAILDWWGRHLR